MAHVLLKAMASLKEKLPSNVSLKNSETDRESTNEIVFKKPGFQQLQTQEVSIWDRFSLAYRG
jgi:hypothetical protein